MAVYIFVIGILMASTLGAILSTQSAQRADRPVEMVLAQHELNMYRAYSYAAAEYVKATPYAGGGLQTVLWQDLRDAPTTPPGLRELDIPDTWVLRRADTRWALCAPVSGATMSMFLQLYPAELRSPLSPPVLKDALVNGSGGTGDLSGNMPSGVSVPSAEALDNMVVTGESDPLEGVIYAALCQ